MCNASLSDLFVLIPQAVNDEDYNKTVRCTCGVEVWWRCGMEVCGYFVEV